MFCVWSFDFGLDYMDVTLLVIVFLSKEKKFYLSLGKSNTIGQFGFPSDGDVSAVVELLLKLQTLVIAIHDPVLVLRPRPT